MKQTMSWKKPLLSVKRKEEQCLSYTFPLLSASSWDTTSPKENEWRGQDIVRWYEIKWHRIRLYKSEHKDDRINQSDKYKIIQNFRRCYNDEIALYKMGLKVIQEKETI